MISKKILPLLILLLGIGAFFVFFNKSGPEPETMLQQDPLRYLPRVSDNYPFYTISEINNINSTGIYNTQGYIVFISYCLPCPKGALCEKCDEPHIVISEKNDFDDKWVFLVDTRVGKKRFRYSNDFLCMDSYSGCPDQQEIMVISSAHWWYSPAWDYLFELDALYNLTLNASRIEGNRQPVYHPEKPSQKMLYELIGIDKV